MTAGHSRAQDRAPRRSTAARRGRIVSVAMRHFAERGYEGTRMDAIASELGIAKGSIFQYFGSKAGLFLAAYKDAVRSLRPYQEAPPEVRAEGIFAMIRYSLVHSDHLIREDWVPYRVMLLGSYATELRLKREINRFLVEEDPFGTVALVREGIERGEIRTDIDPGLIVAMIDWLNERIQDALVTEELDPGLFRQHGEVDARATSKIEQFMQLLEGAVRADGARRAGRHGASTAPSLADPTSAA